MKSQNSSSRVVGGLGDPNDPGPQDPGPNDPGPQDPGPQDPGPQDPGPQDPPVTKACNAQDCLECGMDFKSTSQLKTLKNPGETCENGNWLYILRKHQNGFWFTERKHLPDGASADFQFNPDSGMYAGCLTRQGFSADDVAYDRPFIYDNGYFDDAVKKHKIILPTNKKIVLRHNELIGKWTVGSDTRSLRPKFHNGKILLDWTEAGKGWKSEFDSGFYEYLGRSGFAKNIQEGAYINSISGYSNVFYQCFSE
jgi:hypothetical protein